LILDKQVLVVMEEMVMMGEGGIVLVVQKEIIVIGNKLVEILDMLREELTVLWVQKEAILRKRNKLI
jgi:hypothetical protein